MAKLEDHYLNGTPRELGLEPVQQSITGRAGWSGEPTLPTYGRFLVSPLPLSTTYQPDALRQFYRGGIPQSRIFPQQR